ncbi:Uncharacterized protein SCF082_LOCUS16483, partial [Durusdinium trenchii]
PGTPLIDAEFQTFAQNTLGALASLSDISVLKRLLFEAHTLTLAQLRETVTNPDAPTTRKLPPVEREAKMRQLKARLTGVVIERQLEPSYELLDSVVQQWESRQLRYLTPEKCSSREFEVTMSKSSRQISLDADKMVVKESKTTPDQFAGTEMLVFEALRRRGIAYAFADVISWQTHERYLQSLFSHLRNDPPAGYNKPTLQQVLKADRQTFMKLIQDDVPVRRDSMNVLALDNQLLAALSSYDVGFHLLPLPKPAGKGDRGWPKGQGEKGDHWGFATAEETAYPMPLARAIANCFVLIACNRGIQPLPSTLQDVQPLSLDALRAMRAQAGQQPRATKIPPIVPTYATKIHVSGLPDDLPHAVLFHSLAHPLTLRNPIGTLVLPKGAKLSSVQPKSIFKGGEIFADCRCVPMIAREAQLDNSPVVQTWGIPWTEAQFVEQAAKHGHPAKLDAMLPSALRQAIVRFQQSTPGQRCTARAKKLSFWCSRARELVQPEREFKEAMPPSVKKVLAGKRILLWKEMLESVDYPDMGVVNEFAAGSMLTGETETTGLWPAKFVPAQMTESDLFELSARDRPALSSKSLAGMDDEVALTVWEQTLQEVDDGVLEGPMPLHTVPDHLPLSRRFGVKQGSKIRNIDDFSQNPGDDTLSAFRMNALPFGSVRSVHSFLRVAHSIWYLGVELFDILWCGYFDDFMAFGLSEECSSVTDTIHMLFDLIGWKFARSGDKASPFSSTMKALGVMIDVSNMSSGLVLFDNTPMRKSDLIESLDKVIKKGSLPRHEALRLRGRLQFASGQIFGRTARSCLAVLTSHAYSPVSSKLSNSALSALETHRRLLNSNIPRKISARASRTWFVFTDASYETTDG